MKKIFILSGLMIASFGLIATPTYAAKDASVDEPIIQETIKEELIKIPFYAAEGDPVDELTTEEVVEDELTLEEEQELFQAELSAIIAEVFAWVGGFSGLGALLLFLLRFIRERAVLKTIRDEVTKAKESGESSTLAVNKLVEVVQTYSKREQAMEKMIVGLIQVSDLHPEDKRQIIEGLQNDSITVQDVFAAGLVQVEAQAQQNTQIKAEIRQTTASLLTKLAEKDKV